MTEKCTFSSFTHVRQTCFAYNFFSAFKKKLFQWILNQHEILRFFIPFLAILVLFSNFEAKRAKKRRQKSINVLSKCALDLNFAPIKGSVFLIF